MILPADVIPGMDSHFETGVARLRLAAIDYYNSYYGRLAVARLEGVRGGAITPTLRREPLADTAAVPTSDEISVLLATGLNREAMGELQYAQRMWGDSPRLQATIALAHRRLGNLRARADRTGGTCDIRRGADSGTVVRWTVPRPIVPAGQCQRSHDIPSEQPFARSGDGRILTP